MTKEEIEKWGTEIDRWIFEACRDNEALSLNGWIKWQWRKMPCAMGVARPLRYLIRFSLPLWSIADEWNRRNTTKHEACHIIARWKANERIRPHGEEWRRAMARCGEVAEIKHHLPIPPRPKVAARCGCPERRISKNLAGRIRNGRIYRCLVCGRLIEVG